MIQKLNKFYSDLTTLTKECIKKLEPDLPYEKLFTLIGGCIILYKFSIIGRRVLYNISQSPKSLESIYGKGTWAVITGPTSGLGYHFACYLAQHGFSICLIGRDVDRLTKVEQDLKKLNPNISTKIINVNFTNSLLSGLWLSVKAELEKIEISILINNVGVGTSEFFTASSNPSAKDLISINCATVSHLTKIVLPMMQKRKSRSAIINVSCSEGLNPIPYISLYSASKAFVHSFTQSLQNEKYVNIDILSYTPFHVETNMSLKSNHFLRTTPEICVRSCFRVLGKYPTSAGSILHRIIVYMRSWYPNLWTNFTYSLKKGKQYQSGDNVNKHFEYRLQNMIEEEDN